MSDRIIRPLEIHFPKTIRRLKLTAWAAAPLILAACLNSPAPAPNDPQTRDDDLSTALAVTTNLQAEDAILSGAIKAAAQTGFTGTGYADYQNASGDFIRWSASIAAAGKYSLRFRYANGGSASRPLSIKVNGSTLNAGLAFPPTGSWTTWATVSMDANLNAGTNTVQATAIGSSGGNFDYLQVYGPATTMPTPTWRNANMTWFTSYPDPGSEECLAYNGCAWAGQFAALDGVQPESWVKANNIIAVHERDFSKYRLKTFRLKQGTHQIDAKVYDMCSDADCNGCCTRNAASTGFLIDVEKYTAERFGTQDGIITWTCLDCN